MSKSGNSGRTVVIRINGQEFRVEADRATGRELRRLAGLQDTEATDLFLEERGLTEDTLIGEDDEVFLHEGMQFFSTPRMILMG